MDQWIAWGMFFSREITGTQETNHLSTFKASANITSQKKITCPTQKYKSREVCLSNMKPR